MISPAVKLDPNTNRKRMHQQREGENDHANRSGKRGVIDKQKFSGSCLIASTE